MDRVILHSDCNSFYASVELLHRPELRDKPLSVGGDAEDRHGIILASNPIAKRAGVKTGEALWQARLKCPGLVIVPPDYDLYMRFSRLAREIYLDYTDRVEPFGLDESWLDCSDSTSQPDGMKLAQEISDRVKFELGITVSIGVSYNKIFAKLGSDYKKPDAITAITRENFRDIAFPLPVGDLLYVGRATERKLRELGVYTIGDLAGMPQELLRQRFGKWGEVLHVFSNGMDTSPVSKYDARSLVKSVGNSTTTPRDLTCDEDAKIIFYVLADSVSRRLREQGLKGRVVEINVRSTQLCWFTRQRKLTMHTTLAGEIAAAALELFRANYDWREPVRSLGISVSDLVGSGDCQQRSLFEEDARRQRRESLELAVDGLKQRYGTYAVQPAVLLKDRYLAGFDPKLKHVVHPTAYFKEAIR